MIIYLLRRLLLALATLGILTLVSFSVSYYTPNAPLGGAHLFDAYSFYFLYWATEWENAPQAYIYEQGE